MERREAQDLIEQAALSADKLVSRLQRDRTGLTEEGQKAVDRAAAAAQGVMRELPSTAQRRTS